MILSPVREQLVQYINKAWKKWNHTETALKAGRSSKEREWGKSIQYWMMNTMETGKDESPANHASIAFLLIYEGKYSLFAGDASPDVMVSSGKEFLRRSGKQEEYMKVEAIKLPHHGSSHNINMEFLQFFRTTNYLVSTSGNMKNQHPGKITFAMIAKALLEGEAADIYSSYDWWTKEEFFCAERDEDNWDSLENSCELSDESGNRKQLKFHKLKEDVISIGEEIFLGQ